MNPKPWCNLSLKFVVVTRVPVKYSTEMIQITIARGNHMSALM